MKPKHKAATLLHLAEAEKAAFGVSTVYGRKWKQAYEEAKKTHTVTKAIEIADRTPRP